MQILLGVHETIIKINSKSIKIDYIQHYINRYFKNSIVRNNAIFVPKSDKNYYHRTFLLKWIYTLYTKKTKNNIPALKDSLVQRQSKAIKILLSEDILYRLSYKVIDKENIQINIQPFNSKIIFTLKEYFESDCFNVGTSINIKLESKEKKLLLKKLIYSKNIIKEAHLHIYNNKIINDFIEYEEKIEEENKIDYIKEAHILLGSFANDDAKTIKKKYKTLAKKYHPDKADINDTESINLYTKKFQNILQAYETLIKKVS